jgi:uncharacterized protein with HEPN domain
MPRDSAILLDIAEFARRAIRHVGAMDAAAFEKDDLVQDAVIRCIGAIGEAAGRVSVEMRSAHPEIPWSAIVGMRNRLVHEYDAIDAVEVFNTVREDLPPLLEQIESLLPEG